MKTDSTTQLILRASARANKSYAFNDDHNENIPAQMWFQDSQEGEILFLVFYSQACRWSRCLGCNLPSKMSSRHVGFKALMAQVDHVFRDPAVMDRRESITKVIVSNNGSMFDQATFSTTAFMYFLAALNLNLPRLSALSVETRPEYVDLAELEVISRALVEGQTPTTLEIALGFEAFDDHIRNDVFDKGLKLEVFERFVKDMAPYGYRLKCYFMQKPVPKMSDAEAVADIRDAVNYLDRIAGQYPLAINMHLNPTYVAAGTMLEEAFRQGEYEPPRLRDVAEAVTYAKGKRLSVFVGLNDEGLAIEGGSFIRPGDEPFIAPLAQFNRTQNYSVLEDALRTHSDGTLFSCSAD